MDEGIFDLEDSEAEISRLERPAIRKNWATPDGATFDLTIPPTVYPPREDTDLLCRTLRELGPGKGKRLLEIGCGSGAVSMYAASLGYRVRACDINPFAVASTKANSKRFNLAVEAYEGGPGPHQDGVPTQWAGQNAHDLIVWNLPYLDQEHAQGDVLGPLEEAALLDTDSQGLVSRLMMQVRENQLLTKRGLILLVVSNNSKGDNAEKEAQKSGFAARCIATHEFEDGEMLRVLAVWTPYSTSSIHRYERVESTNETAMEEGENEGDLFIAQQQTKGRGRRGRTWLSASTCFAGSWLVQKGTRASNPGLLQILCGLAALDASVLMGINNDQIALKWPNDVYLHDHTGLGKLGGVLVEGKSKGKEAKIIAGIGINFSTAEPNEATFSMAYMSDCVDEASVEVYALVLHATLASYLERRADLPDPKTEAHLEPLERAIKASQSLLGKPIYRNKTWFVAGLENNGNLRLTNQEGEEVTLNDGEAIQWENLKTN